VFSWRREEELMPQATPAAVRKQIEAGRPDPIYLLLGEDDVEKSALAHEFEALVDEGLRAFNVETMHAGDVTSGDRLAAFVSGLVSAVRTLPMMSPRRVVMVFQAGSLLVPKRESDAADRALDALEHLFTNPGLETTIVLVAGPLDKRGRMYKLLTKQATLVECGSVEDLADAERWIRTKVVAAGVEIEAPAARLLAERDGVDVKRLRNDVDRLLLYTLGQKVITVADVREIAGPATLQDDWALTNAIEAGDAKAALRQIALTMDVGAPPEKVLGQLGWLVRTKFPTLTPAGLPGAIASLFRTDVDLKSSAGEPRILLERLVVELCAERRTRVSGRR
jgi:DNA polymerase III subunit delta